MTDLSREVQEYIVTALARYGTPTQVARAVKEEFGIEITRQAVFRYSPERPGADVAKTLAALFKRERKKYNEVQDDDLPTLGRGGMKFRCRILQRMAFDAEAKGQIAVAAALLKQIAMEEGGSFASKAAAAAQQAGAAASESVEDRVRKVRDALFQMDEATAPQ